MAELAQWEEWVVSTPNKGAVIHISCPAVETKVCLTQKWSTCCGGCQKDFPMEVMAASLIKRLLPK